MKNNISVTSNHLFLIIALFVASIASYLLVEPYINSIIMAFIISLLLHPTHKRIANKMTKYPNVAAIISCILLTVIIVIPLWFVFSALLKQASIFSQTTLSIANVNNLQSLLNNDWITFAIDFVNDYLPFIKVDATSISQKISEFVSAFGTQLVKISAQLLTNATNFVVAFFLMLFVLFFLLRDHDKIVSSIYHILPLSRSQEDKIFCEIEQVSKSAIMGSFLTAIAQGITGGFGMWLAGFPGLFWGTIIGFASFIPVVGTALIWIPASIYLFLIAQNNWAIFLILWSLIVVGSIDNLLRPILMKGNAGMNTLMIFFSLLGGLQLFGLSGLIYGPLIFAITIVLFKLYEEEFHNFLEHQDNS